MDLLRFEYNQKYFVFDYETVNLALSLGDAEIQAPWQVGFQSYVGNKLKRSEEYYIWWEDLIQKMNLWGKGARTITGFDEQKYKEEAKDPTVVLSYLEFELLKKDVISISANGFNFDYAIHSIFRHLLERKPDHSYLFRHVDIQILQKAFVLKLAIPPIGTKEYLAFCIKLSMYRDRTLKTSLTYLCKEYGVSYEASRHHKEAGYDCQITFEVFQKMIKKIDIGLE